MRLLPLAALLCSCSPAPAPPPGRGVEVPRAEPEPPLLHQAEPASSPRVVERGVCAKECVGAASGELTAALRERAAQARPCYEQELKRDPAVRGRLLVTLLVAEDGALCESKISSTTMTVSSELETCLSAMFDARYPPPAGGCIQVVIPLAFVPLPEQ